MSVAMNIFVLVSFLEPQSLSMRTLKCKFLSVAFFQNWLSWVVTMDDSIFLPDQLTNTGSFLPVCIPLKDSFFIFMRISKCSIKSVVLNNIVGQSVGTGFWLTATNIHNPFHHILDFCNSLIAIFDIESGWETFPRRMYMRM